VILDQYGREIRSEKPILDEIAVQTVRDRYGSYPSQGLTPERLTRIFKEADQGDVTRQAELFEEMEEKDLHLGGVLQTRRLAAAGLDWEVIPASPSAKDKSIAQAAREMIDYIEDWDEVLLDALDAIGKGFSVQEIMWELAEGKAWVKTCEWVHQKRFTFNSPDAILKFPRLLTDDAPVWGEDLPPNKFVVHLSKARSGFPSRGGLLRPCSWAYLFKNFDIKYWMVFLELFSVPMRLGKYKTGATPKDIDVLKQAVFSLGVDAAAVISESTVIEILEAKGKGSSSGTVSFGDFAEFWDRAMSKGVLGHTGSAEGTPGRLGGEDQAKEVRRDLLESDAQTLMKTVKFQLLKPWTVFNYGPDAGIPGFQLHYAEGEDLEKTAKVYGTLAKDVGFTRIGVKHIHERFGIPEPARGEQTLADLARDPAGRVAKETDRERMANKSAAGSDPVRDAQRGIDGLADDAAAEGAPDLAGIEAIVNEAASFEDLQDRLAEAYRGIGMDGFRRVLSEALIRADLTGRALE
jgi:phage gp29-like protein